MTTPDQHSIKGRPMKWSNLLAYLKADLFRYAGDTSSKSALKHFLFTPGYNYTVWMRSTKWSRSFKLGKIFIYPFCKWRLLHSRYKYGIAIAEQCEVGPGLFINRFGGIYVHHDTVIGANVNITHGTVLGYMNRGERQGAPLIGDQVFFGSGAKVIGLVEVGYEASVGVNAVVTKDVPPRGVAVGIPAKVIGSGGSEGYINRMAPPSLVRASGWRPPENKNLTDHHDQ